MARIIIFLLFGFLSLSALDWHTYEDAVEMQKKSSKIIMLDVVRTHCQYCIKMSKNVFHDKEMSKWLEERFIAVKVNLDIDELPLDVEVQMTPTFYFIGKNKKILKVIPGSWSIDDFKDLTKKIKGE
ncbi:MAG: DUF255 domain-containing protein [Sulfurimonas sp.]|nr:DUF255 domain-containing protein [Sulfurimonas sp.]